MIQKNILDRILVDQQLRLRNSARSFPPQQVTDLPYLTHQMLLIGGVRGSGCTTLLHHLFHNDYPEAWYTDFADPRLDGFDETDFLKLARLIDESGKGVMLFHRVDLTKGWEDFCAQRLSRQQKIVATVGHPTLHRLQRETAPFLREQIISYTLSPLCYGEFLTAHRRNGSTQAVQEYLHRGGFPCNLRNDDPTLLRQLYEEILTRDVLLPQGIRDHATLRRVALHLLTHSGEALSANKLRETLRIKAVSTVTEHMQSLEAAGVLRFVPILSDTPARQTVNPRKIYAVDTAMVNALCAEPQPDFKLFETLLFNHLQRTGAALCYTSEAGGCDFILRTPEGKIKCIQSAYTDDPELLETKIEGLCAALQLTGEREGLLLTPDRNETLFVGELKIELLDADSFLSIKDIK